MKRALMAYWATTAVLSFAMVSGGAAELARLPQNIEGMVRLGYPLYFVTIIGVWKVLGGIVLLAPRFPRLKEWAYAGIVFNMTGAFASHAVVGDGFRHLIATGSLSLLAIASWALRPKSRILGTLREQAVDPPSLRVPTRSAA